MKIRIATTFILVAMLSPGVHAQAECSPFPPKIDARHPDLKSQTEPAPACKVGATVIDARLRAALIDTSTLAMPVVDTAHMQSWEPVGELNGSGRQPPRSIRVIDKVLRHDRSRRSVYVSADGKQCYIAETPNLSNAESWYGPLALDQFKEPAR